LAVAAHSRAALITRETHMQAMFRGEVASHREFLKSIGVVK
jgi:hypothetical protein